MAHSYCSCAYTPAVPPRRHSRYNFISKCPSLPAQNLAPMKSSLLSARGGMGEVSRARDTRLGRDIALKILPESFARESDRLARFELEARVIAALNHPNILAVFNIGQRNGSPFLVSELLDSENLRAALDCGAPRRVKPSTTRHKSRRTSPPRTKKES